MSFLILDPHFFIYPCADYEPLDNQKALHFLGTIVDWAKFINQEENEFGISEECITLLKTHPRSILNKRFVLYLSETLGPQFSHINRVLVDLITSLKNKLAFAVALGNIKPDKLYYEVTNTTIAPAEFQTRLPEQLHEPFINMLGNLTFARAQRVFPIAAFEHVQFLTTVDKGCEWLPPEQLLLTSVHVDYMVDAVVDPQPLQNPIAGEFGIVRDFSTVKDTIPVQRVRTLRDAVEAAIARTRGSICVSKELESRLKKRHDVFPNAAKIEEIFSALGFVWLPEYSVKRREHYSVPQAYEFARNAFYKAVSYDITDESESVHTDSKRSTQRIVRFGGVETHAYLHVKCSPRIYFAVARIEDREIILLGRIGHLDTARYSASTAA